MVDDRKQFKTEEFQSLFVFNFNQLITTKCDESLKFLFFENSKYLKCVYENSTSKISKEFLFVFIKMKTVEGLDMKNFFFKLNMFLLKQFDKFWIFVTISFTSLKYFLQIILSAKTIFQKQLLDTFVLTTALKCSINKTI